jgi:hypothetical protein
MRDVLSKCTVGATQSIECESRVISTCHLYGGRPVKPYVLSCMTSCPHELRLTISHVQGAGWMNRNVGNGSRADVTSRKRQRCSGRLPLPVASTRCTPLAGRVLKMFVSIPCVCLGGKRRSTPEIILCRAAAAASLPACVPSNHGSLESRISTFRMAMQCESS